MPIVFEQPGPFAPEISAAYGRGQQYSQDAPILQRQAESISNLYAQEANRRQQAGMASDAARHQMDMQTANNSAAAVRQDSANANQMELGRLGSNTRLGEASIDSQTRMNLQHNELQARQAMMQDQAVLGDWLNSREMTRADAMRLQRQNNAVSEVMADEGLTRQEKMDYVRQLKTGIDVGQQRMQATQQKLMQQKAQAEEQQMKIQASHQLAVQALAAKTLPERTSVVAAPGVMEQLGRQFDQQYPEVAAAAKAGGPMGMAAQAIRSQAISEEAARSGGSTQYIEETPGRYTPVKHPKDDHELRLKQEEMDMKRFDLAQKRYDDNFKDAIARVDKINKSRPGASEKEPPSGEEVMTAARNDLVRQGIFPPELPKQAPKRTPFDFMGQRPQPTGANVAPSAVSITPAGQAPGEGEPKKTVLGSLDDVKNQLNARQFPPEQKATLNAAADVITELVGRAKGYKNLDEKDKAVVDHYQKMLDRAFASVPPPAPPQAPAIPQGQPFQRMPGASQIPFFDRRATMDDFYRGLRKINPFTPETLGHPLPTE